MNASIRLATPADAPAIATVAAEVWPDELLDVVLIDRLITGSARATFVAELTGRVVGFVDSFATRAANGALRWEVDLLAVSSAAQGRGIGRRLVGESVDSGEVVGAVEARGLIRVGNVASERVFSATGFLPDPEESELWVADGLVVTVRRSIHVVPVQTFRYSGSWLEEVNVDALRLFRRATDGGVVGAVIRIADRETSTVAAAIGLERSGRYRFWQRNLGLPYGTV